MLKKLSAFTFASLLFVSNAQAQASNQILKFDFGAARAASGHALVRANDAYDAAKGYGFEPNAEVVCSETNGSCASDKPFYFSARVAEGNYKVTVTFGDKMRSTQTTVKAELRRLMIENVETKKGGFATETFVVNVRVPQISGGGEVKLKDREKTSEWRAWDEQLTLEFNGARPSVRRITIERIDNVPTVFLLGDSTVCDQPGEPYASWGQMLPVFFKPEIAVANHAESGESLRSSLGAKRLDKVLSLIKPGDYLLIQYGHNDEKEKGEGVGAFTTYKASLKKYVSEAKRKGAIPILLTPMHRRTFDANGRITNSHGDYPEAVRQAAREENVRLIDLTEMSKDFYEALGAEKSAAAFKPGDPTHHSNYGAYELARMIAASIKNQNLLLARYLIKNTPKFDAKKPDAPENFRLPESPSFADVKPLGN